MSKFKPTFADRFVALKYMFLNWWLIAALILNLGPINTLRKIRQYPWILTLFTVNSLVGRVNQGRTGNYREAIDYTLFIVLKDLKRHLEAAFLDSEKVVNHVEIMPIEIIEAMGLHSYSVEMLGILLSYINPTSMERYIDAADNFGIPNDSCSLPRAALGMGLMGHHPKGAALVSANIPCDGGKSVYNILSDCFDTPSFQIDVPAKYTSEEGLDYLVDQLKEMIDWLEENTPGRMDWDRLRQACKWRNEAVEYEMEMWEMYRQRPAPIAGDIVFLSHMWAFTIMPGTELSAQMMKHLHGLCKKNYDKGIAAAGTEKYRALMLNPVPAICAEFYAWAEQTYGVSIVMENMTYHTQPYIDTESPETMLRGLAHVFADSPMIRSGNSNTQKFLDETFRAYEEFDCDMIWFSDNLGCKQMKGFTGILKEKCREKNIPIVFIDHGLVDHRACDWVKITDQIGEFMENIMKAKKLNDEPFVPLPAKLKL